MIAPHLISDFIKPLQADENGEKALVKMHEYNMGQLPVVDGKKYIGLISMEEIINLKHLSVPLKEMAEDIQKPFVFETAHIFDVMKAAVEYNVRAVPVVNEEYEYLGIISAESCLRVFATLNSVKESGGILELEKPLKDYQLSEVARIVEDNDAKIFCCYTSINQVTAMVEITIKVNTTDLAGIIASFERFNYTVMAVHNETEYTENLKDRYDALMRFLNV